METLITLKKTLSSTGRSYCFISDDEGKFLRIENSEYSYLIDKYLAYSITFDATENNDIVKLTYEKNIEFKIFNDSEFKIYHFDFDYKGRKKYLISFQVIGPCLYHSCTCEKGLKKEDCWHIRHILSGRLEYVRNFNYKELNELIRKAELTKMGELLIFYNQLAAYKETQTDFF